jgi:hypothetical protein
MEELENLGSTLSRRLHWHSRAHKAWGKERLYFYRLGFAPVYRPSDIEKCLTEVLLSHRVGSYVIYELYGSWDLLVRLWLPSDVLSEDFDAALEGALEHVDLNHLTKFAVSDISRHWVWGPGEYPRPSDTTLATDRPSDQETSAVNGGDPDPALLQRLSEKHVVAEAIYTTGIKFAMIVTPPTAEIGVKQVKHLQEQLVKIVDEAADMHINDLSLYGGHGFGIALIMGRVELRYFNAIRTALAYRISSGLGPHAIGARTITMIIAGSEFHGFNETLPLANEILDEADITIDEALEKKEDHRAEVKGSAFLDYKRHLVGDGELCENRGVTDALVKAVLGMLNADGGTIVVGALELSKLPQAETLPGSPVGDDRWCVGVEAEWNEEGWDGYERRLDEILLSRISESPGLWIASIEPQTIDGRTVAGIFIRKPDRFWYYPKDEANKGRFYVRRGASTVELSGPEADAYKDAHPRR